MKIKRAASLVCTFEGTGPVVHNYLTKQMFQCNGRALETLAALDEWTAMDDALVRLPGPPDAVAAVLRDLITRELVLTEGSPAAERDAHYERHWRWGAVAGFYQFGLRDSRFLDPEAQSEKIAEYARESASPPLLTLNDQLTTCVELPPFPHDDSFFSVLYARRSNRRFTEEPITLAALADCLFAANGVKTIVDAGVFGELPMTMTPSGGARNPFELYVYARHVEDLAPGFYHYSAFEHTLGLLHEAGPDPRDLLAGQKWAKHASAVVFLVADFERTAWKYRQALAWRVVLIEAGHIAQNLLLAATRHGLAAAPTGALSESPVEQFLELEEVRQAALFAVALGSADPQQGACQQEPEQAHFT